MAKLTRFMLLLVLASLLIVPGIALAQTDEVDVVDDVLMPQLEAYYSAIPEKYGTVNVEAFLELLAENPDVVVLDVREDAEVEEAGIIEGAIHLPLRTLGENLDLLPNLDATIVVVCKSGFRATIGMAALQTLGYTDVHVLTGGIGAWIGEDLPVVEAPAEVEPADVPEDLDPALVEYVAGYLANLPEGWGAVKPQDLFEETFETMPDWLLDVRSDEEWAEGYIEGAEHVWINNFFDNLAELPEDKDANIVVYCASGYRGGIVATQLGLLGYTNVRNLAGGIGAWKAAELPVVTD
ncbi:MAG: rhodanese-like domain-containing protein [Anaerolineae bacterium]|nr:rhodanese-like domain-containing protein [Anaerolineae bacterium]